jgi:arylsulfatase A-like enzyme
VSFASSGPPDVVVVVLDSGRSYDFPGGPAPVRMPFLESLRAESVVFPRAVSPGAWTVPGHASLFTGLYPWEHGVHMKSGLQLDPALPTIASRLQAEGYATLSVSANGFVGPEFGLLHGFDDAAWGVWWEKFLRFPDRARPAMATPGLESGASARPAGVRSGEPTGAEFEGSMGLGMRIAHPFVQGKDPVWMGPLVNFLNLGIQRVAHSGDGERYPPIAPWIEPTMARWLAARKREQPVFCFVNYLEPHEPYVADSREISNLARWSRYAFQRTDKSSFYAGRWRPSLGEFHRMRTLYRSAVASLDDRLRAIVEMFRDAGRWKNTLFLITGDHGQAFGEHGYLFHATRVWEPVVRVPLWVRWPEGQHGGSVGRGWASLIDVAPTVMNAAGIAQNFSVAAHPLSGLISADRPEPVYTMSDGLQGRAQIQRVAPECVETWDTPWVAAYSADEKLVLDVAKSAWAAYRVDADPLEERDMYPSDPAHFAGLAEGVRTVAERLAIHRTASVTPEVDALLKSWGYD